MSRICLAVCSHPLAMRMPETTVSEDDEPEYAGPDEQSGEEEE